jgi:hypothetical protein
VRSLLTAPRADAVSLFMPAERMGRDTRQNPTRYKNLVSQAQQRLIDRGMKAAAAEEFLAPARRLIDDTDFWAHQSDGLATFIAADVLRTYRLPLRFDELVAVNQRFALKPLFPLLHGDGSLFILAVSQNAARLLHCSRHLVGDVAVPRMPRGVQELLQFVESQRQLQFHTGAPARGAGSRAAVFHGSGSPRNEAKRRVLEYFRLIDAALVEWFAGRRPPMVFAGVASLFPIYQQANRAATLLEPPIAGNPEEISNEQLHAQAWRIAQPNFDRERQAAAALCREAISKGLGSTDVREILTAAADGRVQTLFVAVGAVQWGVFDPSSRRVELHESPAQASEDLLDAATVLAFQHGGVVYAVPQDQMPVTSPLVAMFRY